MSWRVVARKDFRDAVRSKALWATTLAFVLFTAGPAYALGWATGGLVDAGTFLWLLVPAAGFLVSLVALLVGHRSVIGERETGTVKLLLSLPHSRRDVLVGKLAGRAAVVAVATLLAFGVTALVIIGTYSGFPPGTYLTFVALTLLFALAFTAIAVGASASTGSSTKVSAGVFGLYVVFVFDVWNWLPNLLNYLLEGNLFFPGTQPGWATFVTALNPTVAYERAVAALALGQSGDGISAGTAIAVLLLWIVGPLLVGYWRFGNAEL